MVAVGAADLARTADAHLGRRQARQRRARYARLRAFLSRHVLDARAAEGVRRGANGARVLYYPRVVRTVALSGADHYYSGDAPRGVALDHRSVGLVSRGRERAVLPVAHYLCGGTGAARVPRARCVFARC